MLVCARCGASFPDETNLWRCTCGGPFDYRFEQALSFDPEQLSRRHDGFWKYGRALGLRHPEKAARLGEGQTPLLPLEWDGRTVFWKLDFLLPTGSYKDRGTAVMAASLAETGRREIVEDSSGNAGSSLAAYCAASGITCHVFVPASTSEGKCLQIGSYGAHIHRVPGSREDTTAAAVAMGETHFYSSHNWNPWFALGVRTWALEAWEQMDFRAPDAVVVPAGQGSLVIGAFRAFQELAACGAISRMPRIYAVQAAECAPLAEAFDRGEDEPAAIEKGHTFAEGIASAEPVRGFQVIQAVRETGGRFVRVNNGQIAAGFKSLARRGLFVEPTSAVVAPALSELIKEGQILPNEITLTLLSGTGLKAVDHLAELEQIERKYL
ncbi:MULTISPECIES: threonine synthase [Jonquetella]|uniref:Threonine synthase n=1 Tax=Jonquetella anthropi DSM 22815 TaxID=885272 RepID=H0UJ23_9BACT|nr:MULTISPECIES: threonine synthase [Jonquetella]EEX49059.1 putative threonine synthase [Jonquetella anthropi E3_33 E1]EHM13850.1 threonine synthase [Jonquetella anthropi DSM 22815]ERL23763.1 putative threonine synthase [Jonquetella sp. BV3C21]